MDEFPRKKKKHHKKRLMSKQSCFHGFGGNENEAETETKSGLINSAKFKEPQNDEFSAAASPVLFPCDAGMTVYPDPCTEKRKKSKRKIIESVQGDDVCQESVIAADEEKRRKKKHKMRSHNCAVRHRGRQCVGPNNDDIRQPDGVRHRGRQCVGPNNDDIRSRQPGGEIRQPDGEIRQPDDEIRQPDGVRHRGRHCVGPNNDEIRQPDAVRHRGRQCVGPNNDEIRQPDGEIRQPDGAFDISNADVLQAINNDGCVPGNDVCVGNVSPNKNAPDADGKAKRCQKGKEKSKEPDNIDKVEDSIEEPDINDNDVCKVDDSLNRNIPGDKVKNKTNKHKKGKKKRKENDNSDEVEGHVQKPDINDNDNCKVNDSLNRNTQDAKHKTKKHKKDKKKTKEHDNNDKVEDNVEEPDIINNVETKTKRKHKKQQKTDDDLEINKEKVKHKHKKRKQHLISCVNTGSADSAFSSCISLKNETIDNIAIELQNSDCTNKKRKKNRDKHEQKTRANAEPELKMVTKAEEVVTNQWETAQFDDAGRQQKFMRLLGGFKKSNSGQSSSTNSKPGSVVCSNTNTAMGLSKEVEFSKTLENQFNKAMTWNVGGQKGSGLGFQAPMEEGKKFYIDTNARKSKKFDE